MDTIDVFKTLADQFNPAKEVKTIDFTKYDTTISPKSAETLSVYSQYQVKMFILAAFQYAHDVHYHNVPYEPQAFFNYYNLNK